MINRVIFVGKWTLEVTGVPTAINKVVGHVTDAESARTYTAHFEPNGIDLRYKGDTLQVPIIIPGYIQKRLKALMRRTAREI
jgi:hypothetical protein